MAVAVSNKLLVTGKVASKGVAYGRVRIIQYTSDLEQVVPGEVMVAPMTDPCFVSAMRRAAAIVTDRGGLTCHAAIVAREFGIPCIVGAGDATRKLTTGMVVRVDANRGVVEEASESMLGAPVLAQARADLRTRYFTRAGD